MTKAVHKQTGIGLSTKETQFDFRCVLDSFLQNCGSKFTFARFLVDNQLVRWSGTWLAIKAVRVEDKEKRAQLMTDIQVR